MKNSRKEIPHFENEATEKEFWMAEDSTSYLDWNSAQYAKFPNLKPTTRSISIRLPEHMIHDLKILANQRDIPYQSLVKIFLSEKINGAFHRKNN